MILQSNNVGKFQTGPGKQQTGSEPGKFELLGRPLKGLPLVRINYKDGYHEDVPKVIFILTTFFFVHPEHFKKQGLFRVNGDRSLIEELSIHL